MPSAKSSTARRRALVHLIRDRNHEMPTPCKNCRDNHRRCLVDTRSGHCFECLNRNSKSCDLVVSSAQFRRNAEARRKLEQELEAAEEAVAAARAKRQRLEKQLALVDRQHQELYDRELASIEELEKLENEDAEKAARSVPEPTDLLLEFDWSSMTSPDAWGQALLDADGGIGSPFAGNSSNV